MMTEWTKRLRMPQKTGTGSVFVNLVDFDMVYGHRNDVAGYTAALNRVDERLGELSRYCERTMC
jgi:phosphopentomutase